jgi:WD40 repeat protein
VWDPATGNRLRSYSGQRGASTAVAISRDGKILASANTDKTILIWDGSAPE